MLSSPREPLSRPAKPPNSSPPQKNHIPGVQKRISYAIVLTALASVKEQEWKSVRPQRANRRTGQNHTPEKETEIKALQES